ncbi:Uu.00g062250.m01.CDS01 [Anthostomella pinea]|uniref:Uu.00g062250.m01.CDS01 n=1 Tax=Anthostomella pinea TaxID=933095 RepID=A0AAI8VTR9_9PEZI|nr:Uu.00g062250.m01.CDS01 [Anthostomella pinea]
MIDDHKASEIPSQAGHEELPYSQASSASPSAGSQLPFALPEASKPTHAFSSTSNEDYVPELARTTYSLRNSYGPEVVMHAVEGDQAFAKKSWVPQNIESEGLEPVPRKLGSEGLEPLATLHPTKPGLEPRATFLSEKTGPEPLAALQSTKPHRWTRRRRVSVWIAVVVFLIAALAGGLAGGLSSRFGDSRSESSPAIAPAGNSSTPGLAGNIRSGSRLSIAGWRASSNTFNTHLFYQDRDDIFRHMEYSSDVDSWQGPRMATTYDALAKSPMACTSIMVDQPPQVELFYLNSSLLVTGENFRDGYTLPEGGYDSIDDNPVGTDDASRLATYWPYVVMQDTGGALRQITYGWWNSTIGISGSTGTGMAIVPQTASYESPNTAGLIYRGTDGNLAGQWLGYNQAASKWDIDTVPIPEDSAIGAFAVARPNDASNATIIYVLYQDSSNSIQYMSYDVGSWTKGSSDSALANADPATDITCLTEGVWPGVNMITDAYDMSRCYFMYQGQLKQVLFNGTGWEDLGFVDIP